MDITSVIITFLQLLFGKFLKSNPKVANGIIFWANWALGTLGHLISPFIVPQAHADTGSTILKITSNPIVLGFIQSVLTTGLHSASKNFWQMIKSLVQGTSAPGVG